MTARSVRPGPASARCRYLGANAHGHGSREERDRLLTEAEIVLGGWPYPLDLRKRAPKLKWFHQLPAGASNLRMGDLWGSDVMVTTSRGVGSTLAIAEYALDGIMHFAKSFHQAQCRSSRGTIQPPLSLAAARGQDRLRRRRRRHRPGCRKTLRRARHARARHSPACGGRMRRCLQGFAGMGTTAELNAYLAESDFVIICAQFTPETFAADRQGSLCRDEAAARSSSTSPAAKSSTRTPCWTH